MKEIRAKTQGYDANASRQFFAAAAKYLIHSRHWDDEHPETPFDANPSVQAFHEGFKQFTGKEMRYIEEVSAVQRELIELLREASGWKGRDIQWKTAKKRLTKLRKEIKGWLQKSAVGASNSLESSEERPLRGLVFYDGVIRKKYLTAKSNEHKPPRGVDGPPRAQGQAV